jgi:phospholipid/cholesterol/gamma-HCH transport system ATP-binding protein
MDVAASDSPAVRVRDLTMTFGDFLVQRDLSFDVGRGRIFVIMGGSGCGKSTLLRHMVGLIRPTSGQVLYGDASLWDAGEEGRRAIMRSTGVLYQSGALWSSMTLAENVALPLVEIAAVPPSAARKLASLKLRLVGLGGFDDHYPFEISGGMRKRAALARAMALDPEILYLDEPSAGLDPVSAHLLDELIIELRDSLGATLIVVTHELASIFAIADDAIFLDAEARTMLAHGPPRRLLAKSEHPNVIEFITRGEGRRTRGAGT